MTIHLRRAPDRNSHIIPMNQINLRLEVKPRTRILALVFLAASLALKVKAENLMIPRGQQRSLTIPEGKACEMTYFNVEGPLLYPHLTVLLGGATNQVYWFQAGSKKVFAGPLTLLFNTNYQFFVSYRLFPLSTIHTMIVPLGQTNTISIPAGRNFHALGSSALTHLAGVSDGTNSLYVSPGQTIDGDEMSGPVTLSFQSYTNVTSYPVATAGVLTYYLTEEFATLPAFGAVQSPTGGYGFNIEKSLNLTNWFPVYLHSTSDDQKAFYRFRIDK